MLSLANLKIPQKIPLRKFSLATDSGEDDNTFMSQTTMSAALQRLQELYSANKFQDGIDLLLETRSDWGSAQFHELLGSFHMKLDHFAVARYHFEMALTKGAVTPTVKHNLDFVLTKLGLGEVYYTSWWDRLVDQLGLMPFEFWACLSLLFLVLAVWKIRSRWKSGSRILIIGLWLMAIIAQAAYWGFFQARLSAIVLEETPLYEGPSAVFQAPKTLRAGEKVLIGQNADGWSYIVSPQVLSGWIESQRLGFLGRK